MTHGFPIKALESNSPTTSGTVQEVTATKSGTKTYLDVNGIFSPSSFPGVITFAWDYAILTWTGVNLTKVIFKVGGASGTVVATIDMTYDGSNNLLTVTKT
jgi:hypothetical protein